MSWQHQPLQPLSTASSLNYSRNYRDLGRNAPQPRGVEGGMSSLRVYIAHTGQRLDADPVSFKSLDTLRLWVEDKTSIPAQNLVLLTTRGKQAKLQTLNTESEIFAYDRSLLSRTDSRPADLIIPPIPIPELLEPEEAPADIKSTTDLRSWQNLFKARKDWAVNLLEVTRPMVKDAEKYSAELAVINRGVKLPIREHDSHIQKAKHHLEEAQLWLEGPGKEQKQNLHDLERNLAQFVRIPADRGFMRFITTRDKSYPNYSGPYGSTSTLREFVATEAVKRAAAISQKTSQNFRKGVPAIGSTLEKIISNYESLTTEVTRSQSQSAGDDILEPSRLFQEIETFVKKVISDLEHVQEIAHNPKSITQVSKMALLHTRNYLPGIRECVIEMSNLVIRSIENRNQAVEDGLESMRVIASIEYDLARVEEEFRVLEVSRDDETSFELLDIISNLPYIYGSLQLEAYRRHEWSNKISHDSAVLAEEMAGYQEEEERRREKWFEPLKDYISLEAVQDKASGFEVNIRGQEQIWPDVTPADLEAYIKSLQVLEGLEPTIEALAKAYKELDRPTKQQSKRAKNLKTGSTHEANFGKGSLMLRGDDEMRTLKESNIRLEAELKSSNSRIRRLEGLLHRQSHRLSIDSTFPPQVPSPESTTPTVAISTSPRLQDNFSRRPSVSSRRLSANNGLDEKAMVRRIVQLEGELTAEKETRVSLEKDLAAKDIAANDLQRQIEDAISLKKDIMENMEDQQKEFSNERRSLEEELTRQKVKMEELEDEVDRILGSRDDEQHGNETRIRSLVDELDRAQSQAAEESQKAQARYEELEEQINERDEADSKQRAHFATAFAQLAPETTVPEDATALAEQLESFAKRTNDLVKELQTSVEQAQSETRAAQSNSAAHEATIQSLNENHSDETRRLQEDLDAKTARAASLEKEIEDERKHLSDLRSKFAEGETGSEALRSRVNEEEAKVTRMTTQLAEAKSHVNSLDVELLSVQKKYRQLVKSSEADAKRSSERSLHVKDLTQRIYAQNERLLRLLETLGYAISYPDEMMVVQRVSKTGNSTILPDPNLSQSVVASSPTRGQSGTTSTEAPPDLTFLRWLEKEKASEGTNFADVLAAITRFNLDTFHDAVLKRMRDLEHTARKWQKEARAYRDKAHRAQIEAHDKIAFRSFKDGDLALFLPTRNQATRPWAAFNVGAPHYFLREQDSHKLYNREWLVARISRIQERTVDLSKTLQSSSVRGADGRSLDEQSTMTDDNDNPFELSDGLRWNLVDAAEEKSGAPSTPGLGKTTTASAHVDARGSIRMKKSGSRDDASRTLNKSLESRRSSANSSKKSIVGGVTPANKPGELEAEGSGRKDGVGSSSPLAAEVGGPSGNGNGNEEVRKDLLLGP